MANSFHWPIDTINELSLYQASMLLRQIVDRADRIGGHIRGIESLGNKSKRVPLHIAERIRRQLREKEEKRKLTKSEQAQNKADLYGV